MSLSSCSPLARRVSEESIKGWICNYQQTGYAEGTRQHNARVRAEAAELQRRGVEERVDRFSEEVQEALFEAIEHSPIAYGRELQRTVHHIIYRHRRL